LFVLTVIGNAKGVGRRFTLAGADEDECWPVVADFAPGQPGERNRLINDGTSTHIYSPRQALLSKVPTEGGTTTAEALTFDAFDRMIRTHDDKVTGMDFPTPHVQGEGWVRAPRSWEIPR